MSSIAISFYLSVLAHFSSEENPYQILFLDDIFIGLDMSNRLPLLRILQEYIMSNNPDNKPFFSNFQIFITTYDKGWFDLSKRYLDDWYHLEIYSDKQNVFINERNVEIHKPEMKLSKDYIERAKEHLENKDYSAAGNYLRKASESIIKRKFIQSNNAVYLLHQKGGEKDTLNDLFDALKKYFLDFNTVFPKELSIEFELSKNAILNPTSHDDNSPIYKNELISAFEFVKKLQHIKLPKFSMRI